MTSYVYLFWGYAVVWAIIAAYVAFLVLRLKRLRKRLDRIESTLQAKELD